MCRAVGDTIVFCEAETGSEVLSIDVVEDTIDNEAVLLGLFVGGGGSVAETRLDATQGSTDGSRHSGGR